MPTMSVRRRISRLSRSWVILSYRDDHGFEMVFCDVDCVVDVAVQHGPTTLETGGLGVSRRGPSGLAVRLSPRASARAWRSRLLSTSSWRMRSVAISTRRSREASEERWRSGTDRPAAGRGRSRSRSTSHAVAAAQRYTTTPSLAVPVAGELVVAIPARPVGRALIIPPRG